MAIPPEVGGKEKTVGDVSASAAKIGVKETGVRSRREERGGRGEQIPSFYFFKSLNISPLDFTQFILKGVWLKREGGGDAMKKERRERREIRWE